MQSRERILDDLTAEELRSAIEFVIDAYNVQGASRPMIITELQISYGLSYSAANKLRQAVTRVRATPSSGRH